MIIVENVKKIKYIFKNKLKIIISKLLTHFTNFVNIN